MNGPIFRTYDAALKYVEAIKKFGRWPGIICHRDGTYSLSSWPGVSLAELNSHGYIG